MNRLLVLAVLLVAVLLPAAAGSAAGGEKVLSITGYGELSFGIEKQALADLGYWDTGEVAEASYWVKLDERYELVYDPIQVGEHTIRALVGATVTGGKVDGVQLLVQKLAGYEAQEDVFSLLRGVLLEKYDPSLVVDDWIKDGRGSVRLQDRDGNVILLTFPTAKDSLSLMYLTKAAALRVTGDASAESKL